MANYQITLSDESKETINKVLDYSRTVAHYGFIPFILYLGWQGTPNKPNLLNLLKVATVRWFSPYLVLH
ncbi:translocase of the outer mitochondrial membrane [Candidozyma auris]